MTQPTPHVPPPGSPPPSGPPPGPVGPTPTGPGRDLDTLQARWDAALDYIAVTDHARELGQVGRLTGVDRAEVAFVEQAWDSVRGAR